MGIKGTVRRNQDSHVIHSNVDTDIIVAEEFPFGSTRKPDEMYSVIEHFCLVSTLSVSLSLAITFSGNLLAVALGSMMTGCNRPMA